MFKKLHILYTIPNFDTAGSGKVVYDLANQLDKEKFKVSIVCLHGKGNFIKEVAALGLPIHFIDFNVPLRPYYNFGKRTKPFRAFLKREGVDLVHSWHWSSDWSEVLACKMAGVPYVYTKKSMAWGHRHWKIKSYLSDFIITVNTDMRNFFAYKKQQQLIPFGLDTDVYSPERLLNKEHNKTFKIITVANLVPVKGIETLINAVLFLNNPNMELTVLGDDTTAYATQLKQKVNDAGGKQQIRFLGKQNDVRPFLSAADLYVIPSFNEGMPMALVEAMSMGIPILGSDISGINYVLKDFQELLFEPKNSSHLAEKIEDFFKKSSSEKEEIGHKLRHYVIANFSMDKFIAEHESLYSALIKRNQ